jgi:hypothetical protein
VKPRPISARFAKTTGVLIPWLCLAIGAGLVGISVWGVWVCRSLTRLAVVAPDSAANRLVQVLSWFVLFAPFALFGVYFLGSSLSQIRIFTPAGRTQDSEVVILTPPKAGVAQPQAPAGAHATQAGSLEPLDDATARRLGQLAGRAARAVNIGAGLFFLIAGLVGFLVLWIYSHEGQVRNYSSLTWLLLGCGLSVLLGSTVLRGAFKKTDAAGSISLQVFTAIVSRRVATGEMARRDRVGPE